jgi:hypothetical protein
MKKNGKKKLVPEENIKTGYIRQAVPLNYQECSLELISTWQLLSTNLNSPVRNLNQSSRVGFTE